MHTHKHTPLQAGCCGHHSAPRLRASAPACHVCVCVCVCLCVFVCAFVCLFVCLFLCVWGGGRGIILRLILVHLPQSVLKDIVCISTHAIENMFYREHILRLVLEHLLQSAIIIITLMVLYTENTFYVLYIVNTFYVLYIVNTFLVHLLHAGT